MSEAASNSEIFHMDQCKELALVLQTKSKQGPCNLGEQLEIPSSATNYRASARKKFRKTRTNDVCYRQAVLANYANFNRHTLVQHPVGLHCDSFGKRTVRTVKMEIHSLENKICFAHYGLFDKFGIGRGGAGPGIFVFALLDWQTQRPGRRRQAMRNILPADLIPRRVTEHIWAMFRQQHPEAAVAVDNLF